MIAQTTYPFALPPLPYAYDALEPYVDEATMHFHHDKHLKTYVDNLNKALELSSISHLDIGDTFDKAGGTARWSANRSAEQWRRGL